MSIQLIVTTTIAAIYCNEDTSSSADQLRDVPNVGAQNDQLNIQKHDNHAKF